MVEVDKNNSITLSPNSPLPEGWRWAKLREVTSIFSGSCTPQDVKYFQNGMYPFIRVRDLCQIGRISNVTDIRDMVNDLAVKEFSLVKANAGTILFPKSGAAIHTNSRAVLGIDAYIVSHLAAVQPNDVNPPSKSGLQPRFKN